MDCDGVVDVLSGSAPVGPPPAAASSLASELAVLGVISSDALSPAATQARMVCDDTVVKKLEGYKAQHGELGLFDDCRTSTRDNERLQSHLPLSLRNSVPSRHWFAWAAQ